MNVTLSCMYSLLKNRYCLNWRSGRRSTALNPIPDSSKLGPWLIRCLLPTLTFSPPFLKNNIPLYNTRLIFLTCQLNMESNRDVLFLSRPITRTFRLCRLQYRPRRFCFHYKTAKSKHYLSSGNTLSYMGSHMPSPPVLNV